MNFHNTPTDLQHFDKNAQNSRNQIRLDGELLFLECYVHLVLHALLLYLLQFQRMQVLKSADALT
jgi:hypothetical protein